MARTNESTNSALPALPDQQGYRHWGDGLAGPLIAARMQGFYPTAADYRDVQVDANGVVQTAGGGGGGGGGIVTQGAKDATAQAWLVDGSGVTQPVSAVSLPLPTGAARDSTLTDGTQRVGGTVAVSGTFWQTTQPVSIASMPSTPVTGPLTDTQLRATPVPISGTVTTGGLTDTQLRASALSTNATLSAETTKVIGTVNQGTSPWVTSAAVSNFPATQAVSNAGTFAVQAAIASDAAGIAKDATFTAAVGTAGESPAAYTVLDQLTKLRKAAESEVKLVQQLIALQTPALPRKTQATLLHRSS